MQKAGGSLPAFRVLAKRSTVTCGERHGLHPDAMRMTILADRD